jgi:NADH:ubiquinone oxidoreductase subunit 3 (subunit A)
MEYLNLLFFILFSFVLAGIIFLASYIGVLRQYDIEKVSSYECGFDPFDEDSRGKFDVRFYLVSILFIIFDIEVTYLFPWAVCLPFMDFFGFFVMIVFVFILTLGFIYEWKKGALDW